MAGFSLYYVNNAFYFSISVICAHFSNRVFLAFEQINLSELKPQVF